MPDMEESAQPKPADPSDPELPNCAEHPDEPEPAEEEEVAVEEVQRDRTRPRAHGRTRTAGAPTLLGKAAEATAGRSHFAGNGAPGLDGPRGAHVASQQAAAMGTAAHRRRRPLGLDRRQAHPGAGRCQWLRAPPHPHLNLPPLPPDRRPGHHRALRRPRLQRQCAPQHLPRQGL